MDIYVSNNSIMAGTSHKEALRAVRIEIKRIQARSPHRRAYIRSKYFNRSKIFLIDFLEHSSQKNRPDQLRRLRYFMLAIDLIQNSPYSPRVAPNPNKKGQKLYRFIGQTKDGQIFSVQIRENVGKGEKFLMSIFPHK